MTSVRLLAAFALACIACSAAADDTQPQVSEDPPPDDGTTEADAAPPKGKPKQDAGPPAEPPPQTFPTVDTFGGRVIKAPKVVSITFTNDRYATTDDAFIAKLSGSRYWNTIASEYGVGPIAAKTPIHVNERPASLDDTQIQLWLQNKFATDTRFGAADPSTLYMIYYPAGVTVTFSGLTSCTGFGGYHSETLVKGTSIGYAVIPFCEYGAQSTDIDGLTTASSHEAIEWATDPFVASGRAYATTDQAHWLLGATTGGEVGDMCFQYGVPQEIRPTELGYAVQRMWSNAASLAGRDPCVPYVTGAQPFATAIPDLPDETSFADPTYGVDVKTRGVQVSVGQTKSIAVTLHADNPNVTMSVKVVDLARLTAEASGQPAPTGAPEFRYALDKTSGRSGDVVHLTITSVKEAQVEYGFALVTTVGDSVHHWPGLVFN
jgi:hypothetical protein